jgi:hypothetical protein
MGDTIVTRVLLELPIFATKIEAFRHDAGPGGPPVCGSCGAGVEVTACISFSHAARWRDAKHDREVFLCAACILEALELLIREERREP